MGYATPARSTSCTCTMPTGFLPSATISTMTAGFDELTLSRMISLASIPGAMVRGFFVMTSSTRVVIRSERMWRRIARQGSAVSKSNPFLNKRTDALVGREFTLEKPIIDGSGTVRIDDTIWRVAGPDAPAGSRVRIVQANGADLTVAAA